MMWNQIKFKLGLGHKIVVPTNLGLISYPGEFGYAGPKYNFHPQLTCWLEENNISQYNMRIKYTTPFWISKPTNKVEYAGVIFRFLDSSDAMAFKLRWL